MSDARIEEIEALLDDERTALLSGDLAALGDIAARKEALAAGLSATPLDGDTLKALRRKAERNAELIEAAMKGVRSVTRRVAEIRRANGPLKTYGQDGSQQTLGPGNGSFERRA
jgi:hypothetical protein